MDTSKLIEQWRESGPARWAEHAYGWIMPDGEPITLEDWQRAALNAWWEHRADVTTFCISNVKKTGKTLTDAILTAWRWLVLPGEHFCAANDLDQSQSRQFRMIARMCERHPILSQQARTTKSVLTFGPSTLEAIEQDAAGRAGSNHLTVSHTEAWGILYERAVRAWEELTPPPGRWYGLPALRIVDSYAGFEHESETWHGLVDRGLAGEQVSDDWPIYREGGLLLFHCEGDEAQKRCFRGTAAEREAYYAEQGQTLRAGTYARLHLNQRATGESAFVPLILWDALLNPECLPLTPGDQRPLVLGADAATKRDNIALVGCTWREKPRRVELAYVRDWRPRELAKLAGGADLDGILGAEILRLHKEHNVKQVYCDPWQMAAIMNRLDKAGVPVAEFPQTSRRTEADQALYDAVVAGALATFPSPQLREAIRKAAAKETPRGWRLEKRPGDDLAVALSMAHFGALGEIGGSGWHGWWSGTTDETRWSAFVDGEGTMHFERPDERERDPRSVRKRVERFFYDVV